MPAIDLQLECPLFNSFRVQQVAGMFDVPLAEKLRERFTIDVPSLDFDWQIGVIVGPSGSGKTTLARRLFDKQFIEHVDWPNDRAVIDCFEGGNPALSIQQITGLLTAVGFSSPPSWIKPYQVLSGGERFRCDLARAIAGAEMRSESAQTPSHSAFRTPHSALPLVAFDEFTSVVDRNVARIGSAAVSKGIRSGQIGCRFVAVTCHYDILQWLAPDWIIDMATREFAWCDQLMENGECAMRNAEFGMRSETAQRSSHSALRTPHSPFPRRRLRRPPIELRLFRCKHAMWQRFARHHYLSGSLSKMARCYVALWNDQESGVRNQESGDDGASRRDGQLLTPDSRLLTPESRLLTPGIPVAFCATLPVIGKKKHRRISRVVTLPDYQGVGIGMRVVEAVADLHRQEGLRLNVTASHPALVAHCRKSPKWRAVNVKKTGAAATHRFIPGYRSSRGRAVVSFEYVGETMNDE